MKGGQNGTSWNLVESPSMFPGSNPCSFVIIWEMFTVAGNPQP